MSNYPSAQNTDDNLYIAVNNLATVLTDNPLTSGATIVNVSDTTNFPSVGIITIDLEAIHYTGKTGTSFTGCTRGFDGTTAVVHNQGASVLHDIPAAHHNVHKDEIKAITDDLRNSFIADLNDSVSPAATAANIKSRLDHLVTQLKNITGETDWKTIPATTLSIVDSVKSALDDSDTPASTASDIKDRLDQIVSQLKLISGESTWYGAPASTVSALKSQQDINTNDISNSRKNTISSLINGNFDVWQRGTSFVNPANNSWVADRWRVALTGGTVSTISRVTDTKYGKYACQVANTSTPSSNGEYIFTTVENFEVYKGRSVSFSVWVKTSTASKVRLRLSDGVSTVVFSSYHTGSGNYELLTVTGTLSSSASELLLIIGILGGDAADGVTFIADNASLVSGSDPIEYTFESFQKSLSECQRFYEKGAFYEIVPMIRTGSNNQFYIQLDFKVSKATVPTVTVTKNILEMWQAPELGTGATTDTANWTLSSGGISVEGFRLQGVRSSASSGYSFIWIQEATWEAEG